MVTSCKIERWLLADLTEDLEVLLSATRHIVGRRIRHAVKQLLSPTLQLGKSRLGLLKLRELSAVVDMSSAARRRRDAAPVNGHQWSATFRSDNGYGGASAAIEAEASMCASISR